MSKKVKIVVEYGGKKYEVDPNESFLITLQNHAERGDNPAELLASMADVADKIYSATDIKPGAHIPLKILKHKLG